MIRAVLLLALVTPVAGCDDYCSDDCGEPEECFPDEYWRHHDIDTQVTWGSGGHLISWVPEDTGEAHAAVVTADGTVGDTHLLGWAGNSRAVATTDGYALIQLGDRPNSAVRFLDLDSSGAAVGGWRTVASAGEVDPYRPAELATAAVAGELWVAWWSYGSPLSAVRLVRLSAGGQPIDGGGPRIIAESGYRPGAISMAQVGDAVWIVWDRRYGDEEYEVAGRRIGLDGAPVGTWVPLLADARDPQLAVRGDTGLLVARRGSSAVALPLDSAGPTAAEPAVVAGAEGTQLALVRSADPSGYLLLVGEEFRLDDFGGHLYPCTDCAARLIPVAADGSSPSSPLATVASTRSALATGSDGYGLATVTESATGETGAVSLEFRAVASDGTLGALAPLDQTDAEFVRITCD